MIARSIRVPYEEDSLSLPPKKRVRYGKEFNDIKLNASLVIAYVYRRVLKPHSGTMVLGRHTEILFVGLFNTPVSPIESVKL